MRHEGADRLLRVDADGYLIDPGTWDEQFARDGAGKAGVEGDLTSEHWDVIRTIRRKYLATGRCPLVYEVCLETGLDIQGLQRLFPIGYLRGACRLAGITYREGYLKYSWLELALAELVKFDPVRPYPVDARGFITDSDAWDEQFAVYKAAELKMQDGLGPRHWAVIRFLRRCHAVKGVVPTVYETCEEMGLDLAQLEELFPDGYHRGAVKLAGLRQR
jgi:tRNA 2-thiouridine synthesizing protein E